MGSAIGKDVPAYVMVNGSPAEAKNINAEGLRRRGFSKEDITILTKAYKIIYRRGLTLDAALQELEPMIANCPPLQTLVDTLNQSTRGIVR
jgi:UDP-N-acetylglucosamine acyltransferase